MKKENENQPQYPIENQTEDQTPYAVENQSENTKKKGNIITRHKILSIISFVILFILIIICSVSISSCSKNLERAQIHYDQALNAKEDGDYISAYKHAQDALTYYPNLEEASQLLEEIKPLKKQQEEERKAEEEAKKAEEEAKKKADIQTLLSQHPFDGELAVKIVEAYSGVTNGIFMYGQLSYDAKGNYYPVIHKYSSSSIYWSRWFVYSTGDVVQQSSIENPTNYIQSKEGEVPTPAPAAAAPAPAAAPTPAPTPKPTPTPAPVQQSSTASTASSKLDQKYTANGYTISYPSSYDTIKNTDNIDIVIMDPVSGSNITVMRETGIGNIDGMSSQDIKDIFAALGIDINIGQFYDGSIDGHKFYAVQYTLSGIDIIQYIIGNNGNAYYITCTSGPDISSETANIMNDIVYSFDFT